MARRPDGSYVDDDDYYGAHDATYGPAPERFESKVQISVRELTALRTELAETKALRDNAAGRAVDAMLERDTAKDELLLRTRERDEARRSNGTLKRMFQTLHERVVNGKEQHFYQVMADVEHFAKAAEAAPSECAAEEKK